MPTSAHTHTRKFPHRHNHIHTFTFTQTHIETHTFTFTQTHIVTQTQTHIEAHVETHTFAYIETITFHSYTTCSPAIQGDGHPGNGRPSSSLSPVIVERRRGRGKSGRKGREKVRERK